MISFTLSSKDQFVFVRNAGHVDRPTIAQILPLALEWLWKGYPIP